MCVRACVYASLLCSGLGLIVAGGSESECLPGDPSFYVVEVQGGGAAAVNGQLRPGDRILSVRKTQYLKKGERPKMSTKNHSESKMGRGLGGGGDETLERLRDSHFTDRITDRQSVKLIDT